MAWLYQCPPTLTKPARSVEGGAGMRQMSFDLKTLPILEKFGVSTCKNSQITFPVAKIGLKANLHPCIAVIVINVVL